MNANSVSHVVEEDSQGPSQISSFFNSQFQVEATPCNEISFQPDFVSLVSVVSWLYSRRPYLPFSLLDLNKHILRSTQIGQGSVYKVVSTQVTRDYPSLVRQHSWEKSEAQVVVKESLALFNTGGQCINSQSLSSLLSELLILDHEPIYNHDNIVTLVGVGWYYEQFTHKPTAQPRIVLERAQCSLKDFLIDSTAPSFPLRVQFCLQIATALTVIHDCQIIHGDLNLDNILIFTSQSEDPSQKYRAKIADFSHAFVDSTRDRPIGGTVGFMAPEVQDRQAIGNMKAIDIYSLGMVIWRILVPELDSHSHTGSSQTLVDIDNVDDESDISPLLTRIESHFKDIAYTSRRELIQSIFRNSIRQAPCNRNLDRVIADLQQLLARENNTGIPSRPPKPTKSNDAWAIGQFETVKHRVCLLVWLTC
jgi:serine/threonine protein kinase